MSESLIQIKTRPPAIVVGCPPAQRISPSSGNMIAHSAVPVAQRSALEHYLQNGSLRWGCSHCRPPCRPAGPGGAAPRPPGAYTAGPGRRSSGCRRRTPPPWPEPRRRRRWSAVSAAGGPCRWGIPWTRSLRRSRGLGSTGPTAR